MQYDVYHWDKVNVGYFRECVSVCVYVFVGRVLGAGVVRSIIPCGGVFRSRVEH
jgi:hypothetical protein